MFAAELRGISLAGGIADACQGSAAAIDAVTARTDRNRSAHQQVVAIGNAGWVNPVVLVAAAAVGFGECIEIRVVEA